MSDSLWPHGLQYARLPCSSVSPGVCSNSCPLNQWCCPNHLILCPPLLLLPSIFPSIRVFSMSGLFQSGGQSIGVSPLASVLPMNIQDWFPLGWTGWVSLQSKGLSRFFSNTTVQKHQFFSSQLSLWSDSHVHTWLLKKTIALTRWIFVSEVISLLFNMLSRLVITFLPRNSCPEEITHPIPWD